MPHHFGVTYMLGCVNCWWMPFFCNNGEKLQKCIHHLHHYKEIEWSFQVVFQHEFEKLGTCWKHHFSLLKMNPPIMKKIINEYEKCSNDRWLKQRTTYVIVDDFQWSVGPMKTLAWASFFNLFANDKCLTN